MRRLRLAAQNMTVLGLLLWVGGYLLVHSPVVLPLYRFEFSGSLAHRLAGNLARVQTADRPVVLLIGASTVREGFSARAMDQTAPDFRFLNCGSSGATVYTIEALTMILDQYRGRPECIVVGLNSRMLFDRKIGLCGQRYVDFIDRFNGWSVQKREKPEFRDDAKEDVWINTILPPHRLAQQINTLTRYGLFRLQERFALQRARPRAEFEFRTGDLQPTPTYMYDSTEPRPDRLEAHFEKARKLGLYDPGRYARQEHLESLRLSLDRCLEATPNVVIVVMPERSSVRHSFGAYADEALSRVLKEYESRGCLILDRTSRVPDEQFRDIGHLLPIGREWFSREMAQAVASFLKKQSQPQLARAKS